ncbi:hypothetical protein BGX26_009472, partial [Mortierella sp. AD094]
DWNDSFTPRLYNSVIWSKHGPSLESVKRNKHLIQCLEIQISAYERFSSPSARHGVVFYVIDNLTLTDLSLKDNLIGDNGAQALSEALETNSTLITLSLFNNSITWKGAQALAEALKTKT